jgi:hypothetical protein
MFCGDLELSRVIVSKFLFFCCGKELMANEIDLDFSRGSIFKLEIKGDLLMTLLMIELLRLRDSLDLESRGVWELLEIAWKSNCESSTLDFYSPLNWGSSDDVGLLFTFETFISVSIVESKNI